MEIINIIHPAVAAIIPYSQLWSTEESEEDFTDEIQRLEKQLQRCPKIGETDGKKEHPAMFHYFYGGTDLYICEYDGKNTMFGFIILNAVLDNSEWGYFSRTEIRAIPLMNIDYYFEEQSIETALFRQYPLFFKNPKSLS
jgi:hypothetical protein